MPQRELRYQTTGDLRRIVKEVCAGVSTQDFVYDPALGPITSMVTMAAAPQHPFRIDYAHDELARLTGVTYPVQYGDTGNPRPGYTLGYQGTGGLLTSMASGPEWWEGLAYDIEYAASGRATK